MDDLGMAAQVGPFTVRGATVIRVSIPMREPFRISSGAVARKEALLVRLSDGSAFGWGESSAMPGSFYSSETPESCQRELLECLIPGVLGRRFESVVDLGAHLEGLSSSRFARVALETAAWELVARGRGVAIRRLLGVPDRAIPSGLAIGLYDTEAELCAAIHRYWSDGYRRLKIKIKRGQDVALVKAVRREFGNIPLFVDANADYTRDDFAVFEELDDYGLTMFEQPLAKEDLEGAAMLQERVKTPICLDEGIETEADARRAIELGSCRIVNIKLQRVGGYLEALRICRVSEEAAIPLWMGTMPELGVGSAQALTLASHPAFVFPADVEPSRRWYLDDVVRPEIALSDGYLAVPDGPGLGYEVAEEKLERWAVSRWQFAG
jgi:O-succinylbenzoate synthase